MPGLDVFKADGFSVIELTDAINKIPHIPGRLGELSLFESQGITTTSIMIEERDGTLALIPTQPRGAPATQNVSDKRKVRSIAVPHIPFEDRLTADEVQNVRAFGSDSETETVQMMVNQKLREMSRKHDATLEWHRIGSIKGQILDADATTVILDLFTAFNVSQIAEKDFDLDNGSPAPGAVRKKINEVIRAMEDELGATPMQGILAICGSAFFDDLVAHSEVKDAYERWIANGQPGEFLRMRTARRTTPLGDGDIPAILVYTERNLAEAIEPEHEPVNLNFKNDLALVVEVHALADTDDNLDDALDTITDQVEQALFGSETWVRRFSQIASVDTEVAYDARSDRRRGIARMTFSLSYLTTFNFS